MMLERAPIIGPGSITVADDYDWAERQSHWAREALRRAPKPSRMGRSPLVISGHGACLRVERGSLIVRNGRTHHPQQREQYRFFPGDQGLPSRIIVLEGSGLLSFDVLTWLSEQRIPLIRVDWRGSATCVIGGAGSAYLPEKVAWQVATREDPMARLEFACELITQKLLASLTTLQTSLPHSREREEATWVTERTIDRLKARAVPDCAALLLVEARAASAYFKAWKPLSIRWRRLASQPIPEIWRSFDGRRSRRLRSASNRNATHPVNALLNYGYALLHSQIQLTLVGDGFDPTRGLLHQTRPDAMAAVLDFMEPWRPKIDAAVLRFIAANDFQGNDFSLRSDGVCRISPGLSTFLSKSVIRTLDAL